MYYITETINYFWYLLGYNVVKEEENNICQMSKENKTNWSDFIDTIKKDEETKEEIKAKTKQNKWKQYLIENKKNYRDIVYKSSTS